MVDDSPCSVDIGDNRSTPTPLTWWPTTRMIVMQSERLLDPIVTERLIDSLAVAEGE